jgi:hypothetical protein
MSDGRSKFGGVRGRVSYANVMATVAVFIALGGGAYAALNLPAGSVTSKEIARNAVRAKQIAKRAVRKKEVARNAIRSRKIKDGRVKTFDLADAAITSPKLADDSVVSSKLAASSVTTPKLADDSVVSSKLAASSVTTPKLADESVTPPKLGTVDYARVEDAGTTSSGASTELSPPGPELDLTLGANVFATVLAQTTMTAAGGATTDDCRFGVAVSGPGFDVQLPFEGGATFSGATPGPRTEYAFTLPPLPGGQMSFRMVYRRASGDDPCTFSNCRLWVEVSEP